MFGSRIKRNQSNGQLSARGIRQDPLDWAVHEAAGRPERVPDPVQRDNGWVYWNTAGKPVRLRERPSGRPVDIRTENDGKENVKHFWAFAVWNYADKMVQVLEVTQKQIQNGIKDLVDDEAWGDPKQYDIAVTRNGSGFDTEYLTKGIPPKPLGDGIAEEYAKNPVNLPALYDGGDQRSR